MKIVVKVCFDKHEWTFSIPCGTGDKTIKWLGMAASQRYSNAAPNGILRRRDDFCGISERAQYQVENVILPSGKIAHPGRYINESDLKDGDSVTVRLSSSLIVNSSNGSPDRSQWSTVAFSTAEVTDGNELASFQSELDLDEASKGKVDTLDGVSAEKHSRLNKEFMKKQRSNADFMRIVLESQMIDKKKCASEVAKMWGKVDGCIPRLNESDVGRIQEILAENWDVLLEMFSDYAVEMKMRQEQFLEFTSDAEFFSAYISATQSAKIFARVCDYMKVDEVFNLEHLVVALLLVAQAKFNDTMESKPQPKTSYDALAELFNNHMVPLARRSQYKSILKIEFCSDECLSLIREMYDDLQLLFTKYAAKLRDIPTTVPIEDITEILVLADLVAEPNAYEKTQKYLRDVRCGTINGCAIFRETMESYGLELIAEEFSFPEFVEVTARAGMMRFFDPDGANSADDDSETVERNTILHCMMRGVKAAIDGSNSSEEKLTRGGRSPLPGRGGARANHGRK